MVSCVPPFSRQFTEAGFAMPTFLPSGSEDAAGAGSASGGELAVGALEAGSPATAFVVEAAFGSEVAVERSHAPSSKHDRARVRRSII
jgi:hypothetical protein